MKTGSIPVPASKYFISKRDWPDWPYIRFSIIEPEGGALFAAFVLPHHEGHGIGRQLVAAAELARPAQRHLA